MHRNRTLLVLGFVLLLTSAYLDNLRGVILPAITREYGLSHTLGSALLVAGYLLSMVATYALIPSLDHFGLRRTVWLAGLLPLVPGLLAGARGGYAALITLAAALGGAVSAMGSLASVLVLEGSTLDRRARNLCLLHTMYGLGSLLGPLIASRALDVGVHWSWFLIAAIPIGGAITWSSRKLEASSDRTANVEEPLAQTPFPRAAIPWVIFVCTYVIGEVVTSLWLATYLIETQAISIGPASLCVSGFFFFMTISRAFGYFNAFSKDEAGWIQRALWVAFGFFLLGRLGYAWGFAAAGLLGPFFPLIMSQIALRFPNHSRQVILAVLVSMQVSLCATHFIVGRVSDMFGIQVAYWIPLVAFSICMAMWPFLRRSKTRT